MVETTHGYTALTLTVYLSERKQHNVQDTIDLTVKTMMCCLHNIV